MVKISPSKTNPGVILHHSSAGCIECSTGQRLSFLQWISKKKVSPVVEVSSIECSICLDSIYPSAACTLECNHTFHWDCLTKIKFSQPNDKHCKCPLCRAPIFKARFPEHTAEYRKMMIQSAYKFQGPKLSLGEKLWGKSRMMIKAEEETIIINAISCQRQLNRIDPTRPNDLKEMELSKYELLLIFNNSSREETMIHFGINKTDLKIWIDSYPRSS